MARLLWAIFFEFFLLWTYFYVPSTISLFN